jgi:hypothetical protein
MNELIVSERDYMREYYGVGGEGGVADDESYSDETSEGGGESCDSDASEGEEEDDASKHDGYSDCPCPGACLKRWPVGSAALPGAHFRV